jgi:hypothetical protein
MVLGTLPPYTEAEHDFQQALPLIDCLPLHLVELNKKNTVVEEGY